MRATISILAGFFLGFLVLGTAVEWLLDRTAGTCTIDCEAWRNWVFVLVTAVAWVAFARVLHAVWEQVSPEMAPSATEERIRHLKRGGRLAMDLDGLLQHRAEHDAFLAEHYASPLPEEHQDGFQGLDYFPPDPAWVIPADYEAAEPRNVPITSTAGSESGYSMVGSASVMIGGSRYDLIVLDDGDGGRFIPFRDGTCGDTTYAGGRYAGIDIAADGTAAIDFNRAANPWCVYDEEFACPLPPASNLITEPIPAGEKEWRPTG